MFNLKRKVKIKIHVEASICKVYIVEKISTFISYYFKPHLSIRINRVPRHDDSGQYLQARTCQYSPILDDLYLKNVMSGRCLTEIEFRQAHNYMLFNCNELIPFIQ